MNKANCIFIAAAIAGAIASLSACGSDNTPAVNDPAPVVDSFPTNATQSIESLFTYARSLLNAPSREEPLSLESITLPVDDMSDPAELR